jgi:hypothetical protein
MVHFTTEQQKISFFSRRVDILSAFINKAMGDEIFHPAFNTSHFPLWLVFDEDGNPVELVDAQTGATCSVGKY